MKELIDIINNKFLTVISDLNNQKNSLETKLATIRSTIDDKVKIATSYKEEVEAANKTISDHELDIDKLKKDLQELHDKFESAGFREIIEAGNREINGKIIEYNSLIDEKQQKIKYLQAEAQSLKEELMSLNDTKKKIEEELNGLGSAIGYYTAKINDMTTYASKNYNRLDVYDAEDSESVGLVSTDDVKGADTLIDSKIFDEIEDISTGKKELSDDELNTILNEKVEEEKKEEALSTTQALDEVINTTQDILSKEKKDEIFLSQIAEPDEEPVKEEPKEEVQEDEVIPIVIEEEINREMLNNNDFKVEPKEEIKTAPKDDDLDNKIREIGLNPDQFNSNIYENLRGNLNVPNAMKIIDVLDKHFIDLNNIYLYPHILITMNAETLSHILDKLEQTGCIPTTINFIFKYLDKIDVNQLDKLVQGRTDSIITILYGCVPDLDSTNISAVLGLNPEEANMLESKVTPTEYNIMCAFKDIILSNYNALKAFNVAELNKCFTEHPKRFMNNPDIFESMLDKYDPEDLVRCINKNVAVIDKL